MAEVINYGYTIEARPAELGGGWRLRLLENGEEVGGGVFPLDEYAEIAANADEASKYAYEDALAEGLAWAAKETKKQSPNAKRQAAYASRQRNQGRKKISYWMTPDEAAKVKEYLMQLRLNKEEALSHSQICSGLAEDYKHNAVIYAALTDAAAIIRDLQEQIDRLVKIIDGEHNRMGH